jgi:hypothetical protein
MPSYQLATMSRRISRNLLSPKSKEIEKANPLDTTTVPYWSFPWLCVISWITMIVVIAVSYYEFAGRTR